MNSALQEECTIEHLIRAIEQRKNPGPASEATIKKALPKPIQPSASLLAQLLQEGLNQGLIWQYQIKNKPAYWTQSPTQLAWKKIEALLTAGDQTEDKLVKALGTEEFKTTIDPAQFIAQLVSDGKIHLLPKAADGKPAKYSLKPIDVRSVTDNAWKKAEAKLAAGDVTDKQLEKLVKPLLLNLLEPQEFLRAMVAEHQLFIRGEGKSAKYSLKPVDVHSVTAEAWKKAEARLAKGDVTNSQLEKLVQPLLLNLLEPREFLQAMVAERKLFLRKEGKATKYSLKPIDHVSEIKKAVAGFVEQIEQIADSCRLEMSELIRVAVEELRSLTGTCQTDSKQPQPVEPSTRSSFAEAAIDETALRTQLLRTMQRVNPRFESGDLVLIRELRRHTDLAEIEKNQFDKVLLDMFRNCQIVLSKQVSGHVSDIERHELVSDGQGNFYNTVALWRN